MLHLSQSLQQHQYPLAMKLLQQPPVNHHLYILVCQEKQCYSSFHVVQGCFKCSFKLLTLFTRDQHLIGKRELSSCSLLITMSFKFKNSSLRVLRPDLQYLPLMLLKAHQHLEHYHWVFFPLVLQPCVMISLIMGRHIRQCQGETINSRNHITELTSSDLHKNFLHHFGITILWKLLLIILFVTFADVRTVNYMLSL